MIHSWTNIFTENYGKAQWPAECIKCENVVEVGGGRQIWKVRTFGKILAMPLTTSAPPWSHTATVEVRIYYANQITAGSSFLQCKLDI